MNREKEEHWKKNGERRNSKRKTSGNNRDSPEMNKGEDPEMEKEGPEMGVETDPEMGQKNPGMGDDRPVEKPRLRRRTGDG